jgi:hypothetical protein
MMGVRRRETEEARLQADFQGPKVGGGGSEIVNERRGGKKRGEKGRGEERRGEKKREQGRRENRREEERTGEKRTEPGFYTRIIFLLDV